MARNGFVDEVNAYVAYDGRLHIDISQRRPLLRLLTDGMNSLRDGRGIRLSGAPSSSLYVPVVTGSYRPPFPAAYAGTVRARIDAEKLPHRRTDRRNREGEAPSTGAERENDENIRALRRMRIKKGWFEKEEAFARRARELREHKATLRRRYRYEQRRIEEGHRPHRTASGSGARAAKKLEKSYEDFCKLLTFVEFVEEG